jgi:hypothetical protein
MFKLKLISLLMFALIFAENVFSAEQVRMSSTTATTIAGTTSTTLTLNLEGPSGDATSESAPAKVYLPIQKDDVDSKDYYITSRSNAPEIYNIANAAHVFNIPLKISTNTEARYLYAAVKDGSSYKIIKRYSSTALPGSSANSEVTFALSAQDVCKVFISTECLNLTIGSVTAVEKNFFVYFFLSANGTYQVDGSQTISVTTAPENTGIYYQVFMSNRIYPSTNLTVTITQARSGDKRVVLAYSASASFSTYAKSVRVYDHRGIPLESKDLPIGRYTTGALTAKVYDYLQSGEITVTDLTNEDTYYLSLLLVDKFNFGSTLSDDAIAQPKTIEELLKAQSCFLLTAGFGEEHYIIDYFRNFRDQVLMRSFIGKSFVDFYYYLGPKLAKIIYPHESLRAIVRGFGYGLHYLFTHLMTAVFIMFSVLLAYKLNAKFRKA